MRNTTAFAHDTECMCPKCLMADLDSHVIATRGQEALSRINLTSDNDRATVAPVRTRNLKAGQRVGNGVVRTISSKQVWLINKLIAERDTTNIVLLPGQTLNPTEIPNMGVKGGTALIDKLFKCPEKPKAINDSGKKELKGSPKQIEWITKGLYGKPSLLSEKGILTETDISALFSEHQYDAKKIIDALMKISTKDVIRGEIAKAQENEEYVPTKIIPGFYRDAEGIEWKVQLNKAGTSMYALRKVTNKKYEFVSGAIRDLTPDMFVSLNPLTVTLDEAKAYGRKTGTCYMCGRELTKQSSIDEGIGPICAGKF